MRFRLRTLLIVLTVAPALIAWGWFEYRSWQIARQREAQIAKIKSGFDGPSTRFYVAPKVMLGEEGMTGPLEIPEP